MFGLNCKKTGTRGIFRLVIKLMVKLAGFYDFILIRGCVPMFSLTVGTKRNDDSSPQELQCLKKSEAGGEEATDFG